MQDFASKQTKTVQDETFCVVGDIRCIVQPKRRKNTEMTDNPQYSPLLVTHPHKTRTHM